MVTTYPIKLQHENLVPGSEVVTVPGGQFTALVRGDDYTMDYENGIVNILLTGRVGSLPGAGVEDLELDVSYRRDVDFDAAHILDSHIEVYGEVATIADVFELSVENSPINDVFRVHNKTTGEEYTVESFLDDRIYLRGLEEPRFVSLTSQAAEVRSRKLSGTQFDVVVGILFSDELKPASEHPISDIDRITAWTQYRYLVQGGVDVLEDEYTVDATAEVVDVELLTGSRILRRATKVLQNGTDYSAILDANFLTITLTSTGKAKIGGDSLFYRLRKALNVRGLELYDGADLLDTEHRVSVRESFISEVTSFGVDGYAQLTKFEPFIVSGQEIDVPVFPEIIVTNQSGTKTFEEGGDYIIDSVFRRLQRLESSTNLSARQVVKVVYIDSQTVSINSLTVAQDVVTVDYDYGTNSLDWSPSFKEEDVEEVRSLVENARFFTLTKYPADENVRVFEVSERDARTREVPVVEVDLFRKRVQVDPLPSTGRYLVQYTARDQIFDPGDEYYVTYRFGARKRALIDNFAALLGITTGTVTRTEVFDMVNGQNSVELSFTPTEPSRAIIYATGDPDKTPVTTVRALNPTDNTLFFVPLISAGNYTVEYPVVGFETENLREAVIALIEAFRLGPTKEAVERLGEALTGLTPDVVEAIENGFNLTNDDTSDFLKPLPAITSPPLVDGSSSVSFVPSRFNNGLELAAANNAWVGYGALNNLRVEEGSFSFLLGTLWDADDDQTRQFFDMVGTDEFTNRITLYKNRKNLLVFEVHDENSALFRVTKDITRLPRNEIHYLLEGQNQVQLPHSPAYTIVDFDADGQSDIFGANRTEFVITPVFGGPTGLGLNITTLIQIQDDETFATESVHANIAQKLRTLAGVYEAHGAKLTIQSELSFIQGCQQYDNVLLELIEKGHDVHLFIDFPQDIISDEEREEYILIRRTALAALGIGGADSDGIAGGYDIDDFATRFSSLGFEYASAYRDPVTGEVLEDRTDVFRVSADADFSVPDINGELVYLPGDVDIDFQKNPMIVQSFIPITNSLLTAMNKARPDVINSWYFVLGINDFTTAEISLIDQWIVNTVNPLVQSGRVFWRTLSGTYNVFREFEKFLEVNRNRVRFITEPYGGYGYGGLQEIRALQWDEVTNTLTFDPVDKTGYYLFSYISGFTNYEEAEHLITCTWKLHTNDGQPPMVKMFLDGELISHKLWGDL